MIDSFLFLRLYFFNESIYNPKFLVMIILIISLFVYFYLGLCLAMSGRGGPYFISKSSTYRKQVGGTVTLSCQVDNLGKSLFHGNFIISSEHSVSWRYKISAKRSVMGSDINFKILFNYHSEIINNRINIVLIYVRSPILSSAISWNKHIVHVLK